MEAAKQGEAVGLTHVGLPSWQRMAWLIVIVGHLLATVFWWWLQAGGFPWGHPRLWINRVFPIIGLMWCLGSLALLHREDRPRLMMWLAAYPSVWAGTTIAVRFTFPISFRLLWLAPFAGTSLMVGLLQLLRRRTGATNSIGAWAVRCGAFAMGTALPFLVRPTEAQTHPLERSWHGPNVPSQSASEAPHSGAHFGKDVLVNESDGTLTLRHAPLSIMVQPLLTFIDRSPDGCWTVFSQREDREPTEPRLRAEIEPSPTERLLVYEMKGQGIAAVGLSHEFDSSEVHLDIRNRLDHPLFSHLNSFTDIEVRGHHRLFLSFSPCPESRIEVLPFDYPIGRPSRFAFVDEARRFRVVEATSGEKGPFRTLAEGKLDPTEPLTLVLHDQDQAIAEITFQDWSAQASTQISPTAGWGVPVNAIEFSLSGDAPTSPASIFMTLAGTSVGRGWDSVGHAAGVYRNRMSIRAKRH